MKKLKKVLSLVLVLAMVFSFASTAFAAGTEYADDDQIQNGTAVAVMSGIGIINGKENNMFDPSAKFLRSEAAKIMTYMILGPDIAQDLTATDDPFPDVPADHWAAPYVAYVSEEGLVGGWGGNYHPDEDLGREEWLKMLLGVIGYDTSDLVGTNWSVKTVALARQAGLVTSAELKLDFNRDTAVLYAWNAMNTEYVVVDDKGVVTKQDDTYGKEFFGLNKTNVTADDFQRPIVQWTWTDAEKPVTATDTAVLTIENEAVTLKDIQDKLGDKEAKVYHRIDGATTSTELTSSANAIGGRGSVIELYIPDAAQPHNYRAVVINTYAAKLTGNAITKATETDKAKITIDNMDYETDEFVENDVVLYTKAGSKIQSAEKAEVKEGTVTALSSDSETEKYVRIDGEKTYMAANTVSNKPLPASVSSEPINIWYDSYGNIVDYDNITPAGRQPDGVFYVIDVASKKAGNATGLFGSIPAEGAVAKARVLDLTTGEVLIVDRTLDQDGKLNGQEVTDNEAGTEVGAFVEYYKAEDGTYEFTEPASNSVEKTTFAKDAVKVSNKYVTDKTKIVVVEQKTEGDATVFTVAEKTGFPDFAATNKPYMLVCDDKDNIETLYVVKDADPVVTTENLAIYVGTGETDKDGQTYKFAVGGKIEIYHAEGKFTAPTAGALVDLKVQGGKVVSAADATVRSTATGRTVERVNSTYLDVDEWDYVLFADKYEVYDATADYAAATIGVGDTVTVYTKTVGEGAAEHAEVFYVVITAHPAP